MIYKGLGAVFLEKSQLCLQKTDRAFDVQEDVNENVREGVTEDVKEDSEKKKKEAEIIDGK